MRIETLTGPVVNQEFDYVEVAVETGGAKRRRIGFGYGIDGGAALHEKSHHLVMTGGRRAPQWRRSFDGFAVEHN